MKTRSQAIRTVFLAVMISLLLAVCAPPLYADTERLTSFQVHHHLPGVVAYVVKDGETIFSEIRGIADEALSVDMTANTELQLGGLGTAMTHIALAQLLALQGIDPDDTIDTYLPHPHVDRPQFATLRFGDLMLQTSGIPQTRYDTVAQTPVAGTARERADAFLSRFRFTPVLERGMYAMPSNVNSVLAGLVLEEISWLSYEQYMAERFFAPLGMQHAARRLRSGEAVSGVSAARYDVVAGRRELSLPYEPKLTASDSLLASPLDMEQFLRHATKQSLETWTEIGVLRRGFGSNRLAVGRSYGFQVVDYRGEEAYVADASIPGAEARILLIPRLRLGVFVYYNTNADAMDPIIDALLETEVGQRSSIHKTDYVTVDNLSKLAARYSPVNHATETPEQLDAILGQITVSRIEGGLLIGRDFYRPLSETFFYAESIDQLAEFRTDAEGRLQYLILGETLYRRTLVLQASTLYGALYFFTAFVVLVTTLLVLRKWRDLTFERVDEGPRRIVLAHSIVMLVAWIMSYIATSSVTSWTMAYPPGLVWQLLRWIGWLIPISTILVVLVIMRTKEDYKWRGFVALFLRVNVVLSFLTFVGLFQHHFVWRF